MSRIAPNYKDLTNQVFGRLTAEYKVGVDSQGRSLWMCHCTCNSRKVICGSRLINKTTQSCGCLRRELAGQSAIKDNLPRKSVSKEYRAWVGMKTRCYNSNCRDFEYYGGRGILICEHWRNDFARFYKDIGAAPSKQLSLDRVDNDKGYLCPLCHPPDGNCAWVSRSSQNKNRRKSKRREDWRLHRCSNDELIQEVQRRGLFVALSETITL